jgi:hypothetical protein
MMARATAPGRLFFGDFFSGCSSAAEGLIATTAVVGHPIGGHSGRRAAALANRKICTYI